jgi:hypothetical protein
MPELREGDFSINFGVVKLGGKLSEQDRQCAWTNLRKLMRKLEHRIRDEYKLQRID